MDVLLGIILFFILFYYIFKLFLRYALPWLLARFMHKQQNKFYQQQGFQSENQEGEVKIKRDKSKKAKDDSSFGEYVDYEDVDDK